MARSNSRDFKLNKNDLIKRSFQCSGIYDIRSTIPDDEMNLASDLLNALIKHWQAENIFLWNRREATLFTDKDTYKYNLGSTGTHATTDTYVSTLVNGALSASATTVVLDSTTGMTASDNLLLTSSDGTLQATTITSVDSSTNLTVPALAKAVDDNARAVSYTNKINRPLLILNARWGKLSENSEINMTKLRRDDYFALSDKTLGDNPDSWYYDKQLDNGVLYIYQASGSTDNIINFSYYDQVEDMDSSTDDFDFPPEFTLALIWNLAAELSFAFGMHPEAQPISQKAMQLKMMISHFNYDEESIFITPAKEN